MDPYYPYASVWIYASSCIGFNDGIAVGQLLVITIADNNPANMVISGPTYDGPNGMSGLGGGFDQGAYTGAWSLRRGRA